MARKKKTKPKSSNGAVMNGTNHEAVEAAVPELLGSNGADQEIAPPPPAPKRCRYLKCMLSQRDRSKLGRKIAKAMGEAQDARRSSELHKEQAKDFSKAADTATNSAHRLSQAMRDGYEFRDVECVEEEGTDPAKPESDVVGIITIRTDTGEPIEWRAFLATERQGTLFDEVSP